MTISVEQFQQTSRSILDEVGKVIVGQDEVVRFVLVCVILGRHALLEGVPGLGKTMLIRTLGDVLNLKFSRIQFTPDLMPADIVGTNIMEQSSNGQREFRFQPGPIFANLVLADEINRATPKTQSALLEAMQEQMVTVADTTYQLESPFFVLATQNPLEMEGTYPLPEAQLDRFLFKVDVRFPSEQELVQILSRTTGSENAVAQPAADGVAINEMGELARQVPIPTQVSEYIARLIVATHAETGSPSKLVKDFVRYGSSPRGAQAITLAAKVWALLAGRFNVAYDDVLAVAPAALRHRLILNFEAQAEGVKADQIIADLLNTVPPMTTYAIECQGLSKIYSRKVAAVAYLTLRIEARQVYGFCPNGAGKTTTIRMLLDLIHPSSGEVRLFGERIKRNPRALKQVGALVEGANFYPYLSAWDNLRVLAWSMGHFDPERAKHVLAAVGLLGREQDRVGKYSTGMTQRLGIAAALLHNPQLVILDEPTNGLDPAAIHAMRALIRKLVDEEGKTVFLSSHLLGEVQQVCDRVAIIHRGRLLAEGSVEELLHQGGEQLLVEVDPLETARQALAQTWEVTPSPTLPNVLMLKVRRDEVPQVVKTLVAAEVNLYNMHHQQLSLEEFFLSVTAPPAEGNH